MRNNIFSPSACTFSSHSATFYLLIKESFLEGKPCVLDYHDLYTEHGHLTLRHEEFSGSHL